MPVSFEHPHRTKTVDKEIAFQILRMFGLFKTSLNKLHTKVEISDFHKMREGDDSTASSQQQTTLESALGASFLLGAIAHNVRQVFSSNSCRVQGGSRRQLCPSCTRHCMTTTRLVHCGKEQLHN